MEYGYNYTRVGRTFSKLGMSNERLNIAEKGTFKYEIFIIGHEVDGRI